MEMLINLRRTVASVRKTGVDVLGNEEEGVKYAVICSLSSGAFEVLNDRLLQNNMFLACSFSVHLNGYPIFQNNTFFAVLFFFSVNLNERPDFERSSLSSKRMTC